MKLTQLLFENIFGNITGIACAPRRRLRTAVLPVLMAALTCLCACGSMAGGQEPESEPPISEQVQFLLNDQSLQVELRYQNKSALFDAVWDDSLQSAENVNPRIFDWNKDGKDEIVFTLIEGHGTGCLVENLYVFDAETLMQYDTSGLNEMILGSIQSTGDGEHYYLGLPGGEQVTISKKEIQSADADVPLADTIDFSHYIEYDIEGEEILCRLGCDTSGLTINYIGFINVPVEFTSDGSFICHSAQYRPDEG